MQVVTQAQLEALIADSRASPRRRAHLLLHESHADPVQRLLIAMQPKTYIQPQQHSEQREMLMVHRGHLGLITFDAAGTVLARFDLTPATPVIQIATGTWHTAIALEPDTIILEVKPGPFRQSEMAPWSPAENTPAAAPFVDWAETARAGDRWRPAT